MRKLIYNTTYHVDHSVVEEWEQWMIANFIPQVLTSLGFGEYKLLKILTEEQQGGVSFALQFSVDTLDHYIEFQETLKKQLSFQLRSKWGELCLSFATLMEICDEN